MNALITTKVWIADEKFYNIHDIWNVALQNTFSMFQSVDLQVQALAYILLCVVSLKDIYWEI